MKLKTLKEKDVRDKTVLVRTGFDVKVEGGEIRDDFRIRSSLKLLDYLAQKQARLIIVTHRGRPQKEKTVWSEAASLLPVAKRLADLWKRNLVVVSQNQSRLPAAPSPPLYFFQHNLEETDISGLISQLKAGEAVMLENVRYYEGEQKNNAEFAKRLSRLADFYINDAFSVCHRQHGSIVSLPRLLPSAASFNLISEVQALERTLEHPSPPLLVMMGGIKLSTKVNALLNLARRADKILLGGGLANLLLSAQGYEIGKSAVEAAAMPAAKRLLRDFKDRIKLPVDVVVATSPEDKVASAVPVDRVKSYQMILDIGPQTILAYSQELRRGRTLVWNGPMGYFESKPFSHGTYALARFFASRTKGQAYGLAGGGETLEVIGRENLYESIDHVSTGGGAMLEFLGGKTLPGLEVLRD